MKNRLAVLIASLLAIVVAGCVHVDYDIEMKEDGTGTFDARFAFSSEYFNEEDIGDGTQDIETYIIDGQEYIGYTVSKEFDDFDELEEGLLDPEGEDASLFSDVSIEMEKSLFATRYIFDAETTYLSEDESADVSASSIYALGVRLKMPGIVEDVEGGEVDDDGIIIFDINIDKVNDLHAESTVTNTTAIVTCIVVTTVIILGIITTVVLFTKKKSGSPDTDPVVSEISKEYQIDESPTSKANPKFKSSLINPNLPVVRDYDNKYDYSPSDEVIKAYTQGDISATYELAYRYEFGEQNIPFDQIKAINLYKEVLKKQNNTGAFRHIGYLIAIDGAYGNNRMAEGIPYLEAAVELGNGTAAANLGSVYKIGEAVPQNHDTALEFFKKAISLGEDAAWYMVGEEYFDQSKYSEARNCYEKAMDFENVKYASAVKLGLIYECGADGVDMDLAKARKYYELVYENKDKDKVAGEKATFQLAKFMFKEKSGKPEDSSAFKLFLEDKSTGSKASNSYLGFYYWKGIPGVLKPNIQLAIEHLNDVVDSDRTDVAFWLGMLYYEDLHDKERAIQYLSEAVNSGHSDAKAYLEKITHSDNPKDVAEDSKVQQMLKKGQELLDSGDIRGACDLLAEAYRLYPDNNRVIDCYSIVLSIELSCFWGIGADGSEETKRFCNILFELTDKLRNNNYKLDHAKKYGSDAHYGMGRYYKEKGNMEMALKELKQADIMLNPFASYLIYGIHLDLAQQGENESLEAYNNRRSVIEKEYIADVELLKQSLNSNQFANAREKSLVYMALSTLYGMGTLYIPENVNYAYECVKKAHEICPEVADEEELSRFRTDSSGILRYHPY